MVLTPAGTRCISPKTTPLKRLNILQIFSKYLLFGGEEGSVYRIASTLREFHHVDYFSAATQDMLDGGFMSKLMLPILAIHNTTTTRKLREAQQENRYDFWQIHNVFPAISPSAYKTAFDLGVPVIHYLHNYKFACPTGFMFSNGRSYPEGIDGNFIPAICDGAWHNSRIKTLVMALSISYARHLGVFSKVNRWVAISHAQKRICMEMGMPSESIDVVHHFIEKPKNPPTPIKADGHALFVGRLSPEKGVDRLIEAWKHLPRCRRLLIAGDGPELPKLQRMVSDHRLENVELLGFVPRDLQDFLWDQACFSIVPSVWQEPFGMVVLESWAKGRPVVAHRIGALPEIIDEGVNGFLTEADNTKDLASKIELAFAYGPDQLFEMGLKGYQELESRFSKDRWTHDIHQVYARAGFL